MKRRICALICALPLLFSGCLPNQSFPLPQTQGYGNNIGNWQKLSTSGFCQTDDRLYFYTNFLIYTIDKKTLTLEPNCIDPACIHDQKNPNCTANVGAYSYLHSFENKVYVIPFGKTDSLMQIDLYENRSIPLKTNVSAQFHMCGDKFYSTDMNQVSAYSLKSKKLLREYPIDGEPVSSFIDQKFFYFVTSGMQAARLNLDTGDTSVLDEKVDRLLLYNEQLYYTRQDQNALWRCNLDGTEKKFLLDNVSQFNIIDSTIYFNHSAEQDGIFMQPFGGSVVQVSDNPVYTTVYVFDNYNKIVLSDAALNQFSIVNKDGSSPVSFQNFKINLLT